MCRRARVALGGCPPRATHRSGLSIGAGGIIAACILGFPEADVVLGATALTTLFVSATVH